MACARGSVPTDARDGTGGTGGTELKKGTVCHLATEQSRTSSTAETQYNTEREDTHTNTHTHTCKCM